MVGKMGGFGLFGVVFKGRLNSESLATIFSAIDKLKGLSDDLPGFYFTCHQANENKESKEEILEFMKTADIGIEDFVVSKETAEEAKISDEMKGLLVKKVPMLRPKKKGIES